MSIRVNYYGGRKPAEPIGFRTVETAIPERGDIGIRIQVRAPRFGFSRSSRGRPGLGNREPFEFSGTARRV